MIRIIVVDDHAVVRQGICSLLEKQGDFSVVGQAGDGPAAIELTRKLLPDLVVLDIEMPGMSGVEAASEIVGIAPQARILALSRHHERFYVSEMFAAGASGYILKDSALEELITAIRTVNAGNMYCSPQLMGTVIRDYSQRLTGGRDSELARLTPREREVLKLIVEGRNSKEVADVLHLSVRTVDTHRSQIMKKLGMNSVVDLTRFAIREGLIEP